MAHFLLPSHHMLQKRMPTVTIGGHLHEGDVQYLKNASDLKLIGFYDFWHRHFEKFMEHVDRSDLVIIGLFGVDIAEFIIANETNPHFASFFQSRAKRVVWTFDCHHQTLHERECLPLFDRFYLAHSPYLPAYESSKVDWAPTCYCHFGIDQLVARAKADVSPIRTALLPCKPYDIGDRNCIIRNIESILKKKGVDVHVGTYDTSTAYMNSLQQSKICINISPSDDLNIRNFDTWACNRILVSNKVPDHEKITADFSHTYFYERDLSNFEQVFDRACADSLNGINSAPAVLNGNTLLHRYISIINKELGTSYEVDVAGLLS